ncbi:MAG: HAD family hydrolase [Holophaga sp.]|nr:HAD family hydrolase [Holophaga sp.]
MATSFADLSAVGFDLDYTLWDQDSFARSFFDAIAGELGRRLGCGRSLVARTCQDALDRLTLAHPNLFDQVLHRLGAWEPRLVGELVERYHQHRPPAQLYPGALPTLSQLREAGFRLFLVTDGHLATQRHKVAALGLGPWFDQLVFTGGLPEHQRKPSPFPFQLACARLGVAPGRCTYVGDNAACDFQGPRRLGMFTIGVSTGPFAGMPAEPGLEPHLRIGRLEELAGLLSAADAVRGVV